MASDLERSFRLVAVSLISCVCSVLVTEDGVDVGDVGEHAAIYSGRLDHVNDADSFLQEHRQQTDGWLGWLGAHKDGRIHGARGSYGAAYDSDYQSASDSGSDSGEDSDYDAAEDYSPPKPKIVSPHRKTVKHAAADCKDKRMSDRCFVGCLLHKMAKGKKQDGYETGFVKAPGDSAGIAICAYPYPAGMPGTPADPQGDTMTIPDLMVLRGGDLYPHKASVFYVCMSKRMEDEQGLLHDFHMWAMDSDLNVYQTNAEGHPMTYDEIGNVTLAADKTLDMQYFKTGHYAERPRSANYYMGAVVFCKEYSDS